MSEEKERVKIDETSPTQAAEEGCDAIDEKKLLRKIDLNLLPGVTFLFLLSFMDRSNGNLSPSLLRSPSSHCFSVGNARIEGLAADTHMSASLPNFHNQHTPYRRSKRKPETSTSPH